jgi:type IV secretory pathway VirD2 relaxase
VNPAFLASEKETVRGVLKVEKTLRTGRRQAGQSFSSGASIGRCNVNRPWHTAHSPSHNSYSYNGMNASKQIAHLKAQQKGKAKFLARSFSQKW